MNNLLNQRAYLAGAIDLAGKDKGRGWREYIKPTLSRFGIKILDPCNKPTFLAREESPDYFALKAKLKLEGRYDELSEIMKPIRQIDLALIDRSDLIIAAIDTNIHCCGTYEELAWAARCKKPIIIMCVQGKHGIPDWLFAMSKHESYFGSWDEVYSYLNYIDKTPQDKIETLGRWKFFNI